MNALILRVARADQRIRAAYMNGSRVNPNAPEDIWQDYDVVYVVTALEPYIQNLAWIDVFGPRLMLQEPDRMDAMRDAAFVPGGEWYAYLMLLADGNRIDLTIQTVREAKSAYLADSLTKPLLDKDGILPPIAPPSESTYWVARPTDSAYVACCNNFWWCMQNVGKGLARHELPYAKGMLEQVVREELHRMVDWWIGLHHAFAVNPGKMGKWYARYLPPAYWAMLEKTYAGAAYAGLWESIFVMGELFRSLATEVAQAMGFGYAAADEANMTAYLRALRLEAAQREDG